MGMQTTGLFHVGKRQHYDWYSLYAIWIAAWGWHQKPGWVYEMKNYIEFGMQLVALNL